MAFSRDNLCKIGGGTGNGRALYVYASTEAVGTTGASGYFNNAADELAVGDVIGKSPIKINALDINPILLAMIYLYVEIKKGGEPPLYGVAYPPDTATPAPTSTTVPLLLFT